MQGIVEFCDIFFKYHTF